MNEGWKRIVLVHWQDGAELDERKQRIEELGYEVAASAREGGAFYRRLKAEPPCALVIDVAREPERGLELARTLRQRASTESLPLVFVDAEHADASAGDPAARILAAFPDAVYCRWSGIATGLTRAIKLPIPMRVTQSQRAASAGSGDTARASIAASQPVDAAPAADRDDSRPDVTGREERRARRAARRREVDQASFETSLTDVQANPESSPVGDAPPSPADEPDPSTADEADPSTASTSNGGETSAGVAADPAEEQTTAAPGTTETLAWHLGIREGSRLALLGAPRGFGEKLGRLPPAVKLKTSARGKSDVVLLFCSDASAIEKRLPAAARSLVDGGILWLFAPPELRLGESVTRQFGLRDPRVREVHDIWMAHRYER